MYIAAAIGASSDINQSTAGIGRVQNNSTGSDELSYEEAAILNEIKDIMKRNFGDVEVRLDYGVLQPNGMKIEVTGFRSDNIQDVNSKSWYSLSKTELKKMAEDENYRREFFDKIMTNVEEEHNNRPQKSTVSKKGNTTEEEAKTETFVNSKGERILAITTAFGVRYIKIGEAQDFLLGDNKASLNMEAVLEKAYVF